MKRYDFVRKKELNISILINRGTAVNKIGKFQNYSF